jgi:hypothetical protein
MAASSASPFASNDKIRPQDFAPSRRRRAQKLAGTNDGRPGFSLTCRELTPCPSQTTTFSNPNRRSLGRRFHLPVSPTPTKPEFRMQPPPSPAATPDKFADTAPAPAERETLRRENGRLRDKINEVLERYRSYGTLQTKLR